MNFVLSPFHLAVPVKDLKETRRFYQEILGCDEGRSSDQWVDFNFYGHQLVIHLSADKENNPAHNQVDGQHVPVPHFGVVLPWTDWLNLRDRLQTHGIAFAIEPYIRFKDQTGEQATMFFYDPSGNALEFKSFKNPDQLFAV